MLRIETHKQAHKQVISSQAEPVDFTRDHKEKCHPFLTRARVCIGFDPPVSLVIACERDFAQINSTAAACANTRAEVGT